MAVEERVAAVLAACAGDGAQALRLLAAQVERLEEAGVRQGKDFVQCPHCGVASLVEDVRHFNLPEDA